MSTRLRSLWTAALLTATACQGGPQNGPGQTASPDFTGPTANPEPSGPNAQASAANGRWVMGYYVSYLADRLPAAAIGWGGLTHLIVGYNAPRPDGGIDFGLGAGERAALVRAAHAHGRKALAMIGGENTAGAWLAAATANRAAFVASLRALVEREGFDGLDLDWEPLESGHQAVLLSLVRELRAAMPRAILTFPADGADNANFPADRSFFASLAPLVDRINLMTYGMSGTYEGWKTWHSSPLYARDPAAPASVEITVQGYLRVGVPAAKLGVGIGAYGLCYGAPASGPLEDTVGIRPDGARILAGDNSISYANIVTEYAPLGSARWDAAARVPYLSFAAPSGRERCTYISYEDERSVLEKGRYVRERGLGGAIVWNINEGYLPGRTPAHPLLDAARRGFLR